MNILGDFQLQQCYLKWHGMAVIKEVDDEESLFSDYQYVSWRSLMPGHNLKDTWVTDRKTTPVKVGSTC